MEAKKRQERARTLASKSRKFRAYDEAIGKLYEAGIGEEFLKAINKNPELLRAIKKITLDTGPGPMADWSCCVTANNPVRRTTLRSRPLRGAR